MTTLTVGELMTYQTIRAAVKAAAAGDVIEVYNGTYNGGVKLEKAITLRAAEGHTPVIDGGWNGQTAEDTFGGTVACAAEGVTVEGLTVQNCPGRGIGISASNVTVRGNRVDNTYKGGLGANAPAGTFLSGLLVENNVLTRLGQERRVTKAGKVNGSFLFAQVRDSVIRNNVIANGLGEGINIDRGSARLTVENNMVINSAHVGIYINRATDNVVRGNVVIYTGDTKPLGDKHDAPSGIILGDENGSGNWSPSARNQIVDNLVVGSGKMFQVRNNAHNYDTRLDEGTLIAGNTFVAGAKTTRGIDILANVQGRPHGAAVVRDNVIHFMYAPENGDIGTNSSGAIDFHNNAWSEQPPQRMRGPGDVYGDPLLVNPGAPLSGDWVGVETGFDINNYRPRLNSPLIGMRSDGGTIGALMPDVVDPPPPPDPTDPPVLDIQAVIDQLVGVWDKMGDSGQRLDSAIETFNEALYIAGVARDDLKQALDLLQLGPRISPQGQGDQNIMTNESKWLTAISGIVAAVVPLLVAYGVITAEQGELWSALALAIVGAIVALVVPITVTSLAKNFNDNQTIHTVALMENETARLTAGK